MSGVDLLLACARARGTPPDRERLTELSARPGAWDEFLTLAAAHGLVPLAKRHLGAAASASVPARVAAALTHAAASDAARNLALAAELRDVLGAFSIAGVPAIPFKGPAIATQLYGDLAIRPYGDLDIFVDPRDARRAGDVLLAHGYQPAHELTRAQARTAARWHYHLAFARPGSAGFVELHWAFAPRRTPLDLDPQAVFARARPASLGLASGLTLSDEDLLPVLVNHGSKHGWTRLIWARDIAEFVRSRPGTDWDAVLARAATLRTRRALAVALEIAARVAGGKVPPEVQRTLAQDAAVPYLASSVTQHIRAAAWDDRGPVGFQFAVRDGFGDRLRLGAFSLALHTPDDWKYVRLPDALHALYTLVRPVRLAHRYFLNRAGR